MPILKYYLKFWLWGTEASPYTGTTAYIYVDEISTHSFNPFSAQLLQKYYSRLDYFFWSQMIVSKSSLAQILGKYSWNIILLIKKKTNFGKTLALYLSLRYRLLSDSDVQIYVCSLRKIQIFSPEEICRFVVWGRRRHLLPLD